MYKINVTNELTNKSWEYGQPSEEGKDNLLSKMISRNYWGKPERWIKTSELSQELQGRILETRMVESEEESYEESLVKADYVITITDLTQDVEFRNSQKIQARKKEYPSLEEVLHVIMDKGLDSPEFSEIQSRRQVIKEKYSKE